MCATVDANGHTTSFGYDTAGNVTSVTPPALGATQITVDGLSRPATVTDGNGKTTTYTYDNLDRIVQLDTFAADSINYTYDPDGNLTQRVNGSATTSFTYDLLNRPTKKVVPGAPANGCSADTGVTFSYDPASNLTAYCDRGGRVSYSYDNANHVTGLAEPGGTCNQPASLCTTFAYDNAGQRTSTTFPNGVNATAVYDSASNVTAVTAAHGGTSLVNQSYRWAQGSSDTQLRQSTVDAVANTTTSYAYDPQNRLCVAARAATSGSCGSPTGGANTYTYDPAGNRTAATIAGTPITYTYDNANEMLSVSNAPRTPTYDSAGNATTTQTGLELGYSTRNQTVDATPPGGATLSSSYADVDSTERTNVGTTTLLNTPLGVDVSTAGDGTATYYTRTPEGMLIGMRTGTAHFYYHTNDLGSVLAVTDGNGNQAASYTYDEYGNQTATTGTLTNPWRYAGGYNDGNGLTKYGTRYYDPSVGRWTQQDPITAEITNPAAANKYPYAGDNPTNLTDTSGRSFLGSLFKGVTVGGITTILTQVTCYAAVVGFVGFTGQGEIAPEAAYGCSALGYAAGAVAGAAATQ